MDVTQCIKKCFNIHSGSLECKYHINYMFDRYLVFLKRCGCTCQYIYIFLYRILTQLLGGGKVKPIELVFIWGLVSSFYLH